jgi:GTP:adenosylcobinamide-phosphate guanylyltransferase
VNVDAVVLAGGSAEGLGSDAPYKGVLEIGGRPMVDYVIDALRRSRSVEHVAVVVPDARGLGDWANRADKIVIYDDTVVENLIAGCDSFGYERPILALAADIPLLTAAAVDGFLSLADDPTVRFNYPVIERGDAEAAYPGVRRTYMKLREGVFTGGNLLLVDPRLILANRVVAEKAFAQRKSTIGLVRLLGLGFVWKFILGRLSVAELEEKASEVIGGKARAVRVSDAQIGLDVDKPSDLAIARSILEPHEPAAGGGVAEK